MWCACIIKLIGWCDWENIYRMGELRDSFTLGREDVAYKATSKRCVLRRHEYGRYRPIPYHVSHQDGREGVLFFPCEVTLGSYWRDKAISAFDAVCPLWKNKRRDEETDDKSCMKETFGCTNGRSVIAIARAELIFRIETYRIVLDSRQKWKFFTVEYRWKDFLTFLSAIPRKLHEKENWGSLLIIPMNFVGTIECHLASCGRQRYECWSVQDYFYRGVLPSSVGFKLFTTGGAFREDNEILMFWLEDDDGYRWLLKCLVLFLPERWLKRGGRCGWRPWLLEL